MSNEVADAVIEDFAVMLHESGREAVAKGQVYRNDLPIKPFCEWVDLPWDAREGRRSMARWLLGEQRNRLEDILHRHQEATWRTTQPRSSQQAG